MEKRIISICFIIILVIFNTSCSYNKHNDEVEDKYANTKHDNDQIIIDDKDDEEIKDKPIVIIDPINQQLSEMTLEQKIGQMLIVGVEGYTIGENSKSLIKDNKIGGFIIYGDNVESSSQLLKLTNDLKEINSTNNIPLFISVDEEGGRVSRMPSEFNNIPSYSYIGSINDKEYAYNIGSVIAEEIKQFGFNLNFAPVLDINSNPQNQVIGDRSLGSNEIIVSELGIQIMKGLSENKVVPVVKHFPGHGDTYIDSHIGLPIVNKTIDELNSFELIPFKDAIANGADMIMIAHILMKEIDSENPASLSNVIITDVLRNQLKFEGVVITDDITMGAVTTNYTTEEAVVKAVQAGNDIVLVAHGYDNALLAIQTLKQKVENNIVPEARIDDSVYRILKLKYKYNLEDNISKQVGVEKINKLINQIKKGH